MIILGIDTSQAASVALVDTDTAEVLASAQSDDRRRHVEFIGPALAEVLAHPTAPEAIVVGIGPGPFTGLRVGIAAGIAVGEARGIPVHGLLSQAAQAEEFVESFDTTTGPFAIAGDARRRELYFSVYGPASRSSDGDGATSAGAELLAGPFVAKPVDVAAVLADAGFGNAGPAEGASTAVDLTRLGHGFELYEDVLGEPVTAIALDPHASFLALAAARVLTAGGTLPDPVPEYLREPDAKAPPKRESLLR